MTDGSYTGLLTGDTPLELVPAAVWLLAGGEPVELARLAEAAGWPLARVKTVLTGFPRVDWDDSGRLAGLGLTLRPTRHRFTVDGHGLFTWCAMDTLLFPLILRRAAEVASTCPATRQPVSLTVSPEGITRLSPPGAVVSGVRLAGPVADVRSAVCDHGHFFTSAAAARSWQAEHPGGEVRPVAEAFDVAREWHVRRGWASGELPC